MGTHRIHHVEGCVELAAHALVIQQARREGGLPAQVPGRDFIVVGCVGQPVVQHLCGTASSAAPVLDSQRRSTRTRSARSRAALWALRLGRRGSR